MILIYLFIITFLVCIDQFVKKVVITYIPLFESKEVIPDFFFLTNVRNTGAAWSIMEGEKITFIIITIVAIIVFLYFILFSKTTTKLDRIAFTLMCGGAIGNLIDRIINSYVIDFLDFYIFGYDFPVFNLADAFLCIGVGLLIINMLLEKRNAKH